MQVELEVNGNRYRVDAPAAEPLSAVRTVEAEGDLLDRLRRAFTEEDGFQCGFCTPGQLMSALALLERAPHPSADEIVTAMSGNLCRCGAYEGIALAVARAADGASA